MCLCSGRLQAGAFDLPLRNRSAVHRSRRTSVQRRFTLRPCQRQGRREARQKLAQAGRPGNRCKKNPEHRRRDTCSRTIARSKFNETGIGRNDSGRSISQRQPKSNKTDSTAAPQNIRTTASAYTASPAAATAPPTSYAGTAPRTCPFPAGSQVTPLRQRLPPKPPPIFPPGPSSAARNLPNQAPPARPATATRPLASKQSHRTASPMPPQPLTLPPSRATFQPPPASAPHSSANISAIPPVKMVPPPPAMISLQDRCPQPPPPLPAQHPKLHPRNKPNF